MGIVVDTEQEDVKYILEIEDNGVKMYEMISRILQFKSEGRVIAVKSLVTPLEMLQSQDLSNLMQNIQGKAWKQLLVFEDSEKVPLIREAFTLSKKILTDVQTDSFIYGQLREIFKLYLKDQNQVDILPE
jgi:hypothetical protein